MELIYESDYLDRNAYKNPFLLSSVNQYRIYELGIKKKYRIVVYVYGQ